MYVPLPYVIALACFGFSAGTLFGACLACWAVDRRPPATFKHLPPPPVLPTITGGWHPEYAEKFRGYGR